MVVRPDLRYYPPRRPSQYEWIPSRSSSISALVPVANVQRLRRTSMSFPDEMRLRGPSKTLPALPRPIYPRPGSRGPLKRRTADIKVPGAYPPSELSFDIEQSLDDHLRMIEVEYVTRRQSRTNSYSSSLAAGPRQALKPLSNNHQVRRTEKIGRRASLSRSNPDMRKQQPLGKEPPPVRSNPELRGLSKIQVSTPSSVVERASPPIPLKPDSSRTEYITRVFRGHTAVTSNNARPGTAQPSTTKADSGVKALRRLSLGDISSGLGDLFR